MSELPAVSTLRTVGEHIELETPDLVTLAQLWNSPCRSRQQPADRFRVVGELRVEPLGKVLGLGTARASPDGR